MLVVFLQKNKRKGHQITMSRRRGETKQWADWMLRARLLKNEYIYGRDDFATWKLLDQLPPAIDLN